MGKKISTPILEIIQKVKKNSGTITFFFHNKKEVIKKGKKVIEHASLTQDINPKIFKDENGKDLPLPKIVHLFNDIQHDLQAKWYTINPT